MSFTGVDTSGTNGSARSARPGRQRRHRRADRPLTTTRDGSVIVAAGNDPTNDLPNGWRRSPRSTLPERHGANSYWAR
jgi:hypothetical protein